MTPSASELCLQIVERNSIANNAESGIDASLRITNNSSEALTNGWRLYYSLGLTPRPDEHRVRQVNVDGRYGYLEPTESWVALAPGDVTELPIENWLLNSMPLRARQGFHFVFLKAGANQQEPEIPEIAAPDLLPLQALQNTWITDTSPSCDVTADTEAHRWQKNAALPEDISPQAVIPTPDLIKLESATIGCNGLATDHPELADTLDDFLTTDGIPVNVSTTGTHAEAAYHLQVTPAGISIEAGSAAGVFYAGQSLRQLITTDGAAFTLPCCTIEDAPDFEHRGLFIDLARHFVPVAAIKKVIRAMSSYKMNILQLGISNDEGFRLEIPGIPELTEIGARRTFHAEDETGKPLGLFPAWGDGPEETQGHISQHEFIELLNYAAAHHVTIIPELNLPAHAGAIIRSMASSGRYQVVDPEDQSVHRSAQGYTNNVMNVCLPDTYALAGEMFRAIADYYRRANVPLKAIHLGGDEVPDGAWLHSPAVHASPVWNETWQPDTETDRRAATLTLNQHYAARITSLAARILPGTRLGFWHEMSPALPADGLTYITGWTTETGDRQLIEAVLERGQKLVIANASFLYLDMPYSLNAEEPGLPWAAYIDEALIHGFSPLENWSVPRDRNNQVPGLQAQLWSETIFSESLMFYHLFPRLVSVAERGWSAVPKDDSWPGFASALGARELVYLEKLGVSFRVPPPGVIMKDGFAMVNTAFPGLVIRYTVDGSEPGHVSMAYNGPIKLETTEAVKLATFTPSGKTKSRTISLSGD